MQNPQPTSQSQPREQGVALPLPSTQPLVTYALLGIIVIVFIAQLVTDQLYYPQEPLITFGAIDFRSIVLRGEYYRLFTAMFLHANMPHIFFNGLALWSFGRTVERFFGHLRFALIYFLGGLCGSLASFIFTHGVSVGASTAIFAIFGAEMIFLYHNRKLLGQAAERELRSLGFLALLNFGFGIYTQFSGGPVLIDNWGHVGGFFAGLVLAWFISPQYALQSDLTTPTGYRVADNNPLTKTWIAPLVFGIAMLVVLIFSVSVFLRSVRG